MDICKLAVIDQDAILFDDFLDRVFHCGIERLLITRGGLTVASVVKGSGDKAVDQLKAGKIVVLPYQIALSESVQYTCLAALVHMAIEGEVTLAIEPEQDGSKCLLLAPCTEKFNRACEHVLILDGQSARRLDYQLYSHDFAVHQKDSGERMINFDEYYQHREV